MAAKNLLTTAPPYRVERALKNLGKNLRTARLRRNLKVAEVAEKIGTGPRPISDAERGKPSTSAVVYVALLWAYDLLEPLEAVANPDSDKQGLKLTNTRQRARGHDKHGLDDDF
ncbi:MAG: helix-turn-helix domain-containing protein [Planctomycetes bacterium]|nr:helix-turn-helix domain-containing protein [Planctomycetota bacterium]